MITPAAITHTSKYLIVNTIVRFFTLFRVPEERTPSNPRQAERSVTRSLGRESLVKKKRDGDTPQDDCSVLPHAFTVALPYPRLRPNFGLCLGLLEFRAFGTIT